MRPFARAVLLAGVVALPLGGCTSFDFDPGELLAGDLFNTKKPLPGERKPVFPEGVPGVSRGMPPEMMRGNQSQLVAEPAPVAATQPVAAVEEPQERPKAKAPPKAKPKPKPSVAARPSSDPADDGVWPEPPSRQQPPQPPQQQPPPQRPQPQQQQVQWPDSPPPRQQPQAPWPDPPRAQPQQPQVQWPDPPAPR